MISGIVNLRNEGIVRLRLRGPGGIESDVDFIVDSGFTASLTLPMTMVTALDLARDSASSAVLADGSIREFDVFVGELAWGGTWRKVMISAVGNESLLGMRVMAKHKLVIDVVPGGSVEILPLP